MLTQNAFTLNTWDMSLDYTFWACIMSRNNEKKSGLSRSPIFADIPQEELVEIARIVEDKVVPAHTIIFRQGDPADSYYIVPERKPPIFARSEL